MQSMSSRRAQHPQGVPRTTRTAVVALLLGVLVLPGVTGGVVFWRARDLIVAQVEQGQVAAGQALASSLEASLDMAEASVASTAGGPGLTQAIRSGDPVAMEAHLRAVAEGVRLFRTLAIVSSHGDILAKWPRDPVTPVEDIRRRGVNEPLDARPAGVDGIVPFRAAAHAGTSLLGEVSLLAATPTLQSFRFGDTGTATVVTRDARVVVAGNIARRNQRLRAEEMRALVAAMRPGQVAYYAPLLQRRNLSAFEPVANRQVGVLVDMAEAEAFADLNRLAVVLVLVVLGLSAAGTLGVVAVARRLATSERRLQTLHDAAQTQALTDPLTGLANRRAFDAALAHAVGAAHATGEPMAVSMFDLNHFKRLNDTRGHAAGDAALRAVANELRGCTRSGDVAARLGGDEFALLHPDCAEDVAARIAARVTDAVERLGIAAEASSGTLLTVSSGTAELAEGFSGEDVVAAADVSLYRAKHAARSLRVTESPTAH